MANKKTQKPAAIETVNASAAAVDIGSRMHMAAVNPDVTDIPVRAFGTHVNMRCWAVHERKRQLL